MREEGTHEIWENVVATATDDIIELRFHTDGRSLVWTANAHRELTEVFAWVNGQTRAKVVILTGTGDVYCNSIDVTGFSQLPWDHIWWEGRRMLKYINDIEIPVISAVNGPVTIHSEIPVMADIVLAAPAAEFADHAHFPYRDTVPGDGVNLVWQNLLGVNRFKYWLLTGQSVCAEEALELGIVSEIVPREELLTRAWELARDLARRDIAVLRYLKDVISIGCRPNFDERLSHGLSSQGGAYWSKGGMRPGLISSEDTPPAPS